MSLIGPRPERPEFVATFEAEVPAYRLRHALKPGVTGLAQVMGAYATQPDVKLRYDLGYLFHWSPLWTCSFSCARSSRSFGAAGCESPSTRVTVTMAPGLHCGVHANPACPEGTVRPGELRPGAPRGHVPRLPYVAARAGDAPFRRRPPPRAGAPLRRARWKAGRRPSSRADWKSASSSWRRPLSSSTG